MITSLFGNRLDAVSLGRAENVEALASRSMLPYPRLLRGIRRLDVALHGDAQAMNLVGIHLEAVAGRQLSEQISRKVEHVLH